MGRFCRCDDARAACCRWAPPRASTDAEEHARIRAEAGTAELARAIREGRALPAAGDLFGEPSPLTAAPERPAPKPLDLFGEG